MQSLKVSAAEFLKLKQDIHSSQLKYSSSSSQYMQPTTPPWTLTIFEISSFTAAAAAAVAVLRFPFFLLLLLTSSSLSLSLFAAEVLLHTPAPPPDTLPAAAAATPASPLLLRLLLMLPTRHTPSSPSSSTLSPLLPPLLLPWAFLLCAAAAAAGVFLLLVAESSRVMPAARWARCLLLAACSSPRTPSRRNEGMPVRPNTTSTLRQVWICMGTYVRPNGGRWKNQSQMLCCAVGQTVLRRRHYAMDEEQHGVLVVALMVTAVAA